MVPRQGNRSINVLSRSDNDPIHPMTPGEQLMSFLSELKSNQEELIHQIKANQVDIDVWGDDSGVSGTITLSDQVRSPWMMTDLIATWAPQVSDFGSSNPLINSGSITTPTASQAIATISATNFVPLTEYQVYVAFNMAGTPAQGTDNNNISIVLNGGGHVLANDITTGIQNFGPFEFTTSASPANVNLDAVAAATAGAIYSATIWAVPVNPQTTNEVIITVGNRKFQPDSASGQFILTSIHGMQLQQKDVITITTTPPVACHIEACGYQDYRKMDRL
jgi:hypothetical protein